jgi:beta-glucosidase
MTLQAQSLEQRISDLLSRMTPEEKAAMLSGSGWMESHPIPRLGIPAIKMADGPLGVRNWTGSSAITQNPNTTPINATAFPAGIAMAATWDPELVRRSGAAIAREVKALGRDMLLGPTVNINRVPLWGRNFEGYGEDPYLASRMGVAYIQGVQGEGIIPSVKHFAANNQEFERHRVDAAVDGRTLHEIYFPAFKAAVQEAGVWTVMAAYEKLNGHYCAENVALLNETLKKRWGFQGFVISDWGGTYSTAGSLQAGLNLEMPGGQALRNWLNLPKTRQDGNDGGWLAQEKVLAAVASGEVKQEAIDDAVRRILRVILQANLLDHPHTPTPGVVDSPEHRALARAAAAQSIVLLKNTGSVLPLDAPRSTRSRSPARTLQ